MRLRHLLAALAPLLLLGAAVPALRTAIAEDYETVPIDPAMLHALLSGQEVSMQDAIRIAEEDAPHGKVRGVRFIDQGRARYMLDVVTTEAHRVLVVEAAEGKVLSSVAKPPFPPGDPLTGEWTETRSGLKYYDLRVGDGAMPSGPRSTVKVHYTGWFANGTEFDSSFRRGEPTQFRLNQVIAGWTEGVGSMRVGGKRKLLVPFDLGYGVAGRGSIPGRATLVFDVELLGVIE